MISSMHFKGIKSVALIDKSNSYKKIITYMKNENTIFKTNTHIQHMSNRGGLFT